MKSIGKTKVLVSEIACGGASLGNLLQASSLEEARDTILECYKHGIHYFDTAPKYGHGLSERRMGDILRELNRDDFVISTKVGIILSASHTMPPMTDKFVDKLPFHLKYDYSYDAIMRSFEHSLQRLGLNRIDIALVHELDASYHDSQQFQHHLNVYRKSGYKALRELKKQGIIRAIGLGVRQWQVCVDLMDEGDYDCFMLAGNYTLLEQPVLNGFLDNCLQRNISVLQAGPYATGILATGAIKGAYYQYQAASDEILKQVNELEKICHSYQIPLQAAAIQFPLMHPAITAIVTGFRNSSQVQACLGFYRYVIPKDFWDELKSKGFIEKTAPIALPVVFAKMD